MFKIVQVKLMASGIEDIPAMGNKKL